MVLLFSNSCRHQAYVLPEGYNALKYTKTDLSSVLDEVSGICFLNNNADTLLAVEDENGIVYKLTLNNTKTFKTKFSGKGDYEDVAISNGHVIVLRSDGVLFSFPVAETGNRKAENVQEFKNLLPAGEYEGMYAENNKLFVLCKHCHSEKHDETDRGFILDVNTGGRITVTENFSISVNAIEDLCGDKKISFHPSAIAKQPGSGNWFIVSAVNKMLVICSPAWEVKQVYKLDPALFNQPEGIVFSSSNNLYISNEGNKNSNATVLEFKQTSNK